ncbi:autotransporter-associated beta strand repeat-containing protein, partial [Achromobacter sp. 2789STDY5608615]|uniref:autotransporter-associated beta strand repeat-containing protein n=1 Tax=Achromobacter sp. 2789STDY5608615 TaxID=1806492 RepID=UPI0006C83A95
MKPGHRHGFSFLSLNYAWQALILLLAPVPAALACTTSGTSILCNDAVVLLPIPNINTVNTNVNGASVLVTASGQSSSALVSPSITLSGKNTSLTNQGTVDPGLGLGGLLSLGATGAQLGNTTNGGSVVVNNNGALRGTGLSVLGLPLLTGVGGAALVAMSDATGTINITNTNLIEIRPGLLPDLSALLSSPVIAAYGGAPITVTNAAGAVINGRVGLGRSVSGNTFTNAGTINGSVHMGINSTNTFTAVTGSSVSQGGATSIGVGANLNGLGANVALNFSALGLVDGGANGNNTLVLQNPGASGVSGGGTASSATYINFNNLIVNGGTWNVSGPLVTAQATLNGGLVNFDNAGAFGSGTLTANGGAIASTQALSLSNAIALGVNGLGIQGASDLTLSGATSGAGYLDKSGAGTLTLNGANAHTGGTRLGGGTLVLGTNTALGLGDLAVYGAATLQAVGATSIGNNIGLGATLALANTGNLALTGNLTGAGTLVKNGAGILTLSGANSHAATQINAGGLIVGNNSALGSGALTVNGAASLASTASMALQNAIVLNNTLTLNGASDLTLNGLLSGASGSLVKSGAGALTLNGANTFGGGATLSGGSVNVGSNTALGSGGVTVNGAVTLSSLANNIALSNTFALSNALTIAGSNNLTLNGALSGAGGSLVKTGSGTLTLNAGNTFGGATLNGGAIVAGANNALGTGTAVVQSATALDAGAVVSLGNQFVLNDNLSVLGSQDLTLAGALSGSGQLIKNGAANLTLATQNTHSGGVLLNAGTLTLGNSLALGTGLLDVEGAATLAAGGLNVANNIRLGAGLGLNTGGQGLTLSGALSGAGGLTLNDNGILTLSGNNNHAGGVTLNAGTLIAASDTALGSGQLTIGGNATLQSTANRNFTNNVALNGNLTVDSGNNIGLYGAINGAGNLIKNGAGTLTLTGANSFGNTTINAGVLQAGTGSLGASVLNNSKLVLAQGANATYSGAISGSGSVDVLGNNTTLILNGINTFTGGLNLLSGTVETRGGQALADNLAVNLAAGTTLRLTDSETFGSLSGAGNLALGASATMQMGQNNADSVFGGVLSGAGNIVKNGTGALTLSGVNTQTGLFNVAGGSLNVTGSLTSSQVNVGAGASLGGTGSVAGVANIATGGALTGTTGQTLTLGGLNMSAGSQFNVSLGAPTPQALVQVNGNVTLNGNLNVTDKGGFGVGVYRLLGYTGTLTNNGMALGSLPPGTLPANLQIQTAVNQQVNLVVAAGGNNVQFWNGAKTAADGVLAGGSGTWAAGQTNWTDQSGNLSQAWGGQYAVFGGAAGGNVALTGDQAVTGMQFFADGYTLTGGGLQLATGPNTFRVDPTMTGTINSAIKGAGQLQKRDLGTLVLGGANTYTGGTLISEGVLQASADNNLGDAGGALGFAGGTLRVTGTGYTGTSRAIDVGAGAGFDIADAGNVFTLNQALTGAGRVTKLGAGTLALGGNNSAIGGVTLAAGTVSVGSNTALGSGSFNINGSGALDSSAAVTLANDVFIGAGNTLTHLGSNDLTLNGVVAGTTGALAKQGNGTLTLNGANSYAGGTTLSAGAIRVGSNTALGTGLLTVAGASSLLSDGSVALANNVALGANLTTGGSGNLTLNGALGGAGTLIKSGSGTLTLNGINTHAGTQLNSGTLLLGNNQALGLGPLAVNGNAALDGGVDLTLGNAITVASGANLTLAQTHDALLSGVIDGAGGLIAGAAGRSLTLTGANTYQGGTQLNGGSLVVGSGTALGSGALQVNGAATLAGIAGGPAIALANNVTLNNALTVNGARDLTLSGAIDGAGSLLKSGSSTLTLNGANTYQGGTTLAAGALRVGNGAALGSGDLTVTGAATLGSTQAVTLNNNVMLNQGLALDLTNDLTLAGAIGGAGGLSASGAGTLTLAGANTFGGGTQVNGGTLVVGANTSLGSGALTVNGATLQALTGVTLANNVTLNGSALTVSGAQDVALSGIVAGGGSLVKQGANTLTLSGANTFQGGVTLAQGGLRVGSGQALGSGTLTVAGASTLTSTQAVTLANNVALNGGNLTVGGANDVTLGGTVSGANGLVMNGSGTLTLSGANNYAGGTTLASGTLAANSNTALGTGALTVNGAASLTAADGVTLANNVTLNNTLTATGAGNWTLAGVIGGAGGLIKQGSGTLTLTGANTYTGNTQLNAGGLTGDTGSIRGNVATAANTTLTFNQNANGAFGNVLSGAGNLEKTGTGSLTLSGGNTLSGGIGVAQGTLVAAGGNAISSASGVRIDSGATLQLTGAESIASLTGNGVLQADANVSLGSASDSLFGGVLAGAGNITKTGAGTLTLGGASTNSGDFNINGGTVNLTGSLANANVNVNGAGSTLTGSGTASGNVSILNGGSLAVSSANPGGLTLGSLTVDSNSSIDALLGAPYSGSLVNVYGDVTLNGKVNVTQAPGFGVGVYRIVTYTGNGNTAGLALGTGASPNLSLQTGITGQINVLNQSSAGEIQFWQGGNGAWTTAGTTWQNATTQAAEAWGGKFGVFQGNAGTVTVAANQQFQGLQFSTDGYIITGAGGLTAQAGSDGVATLRVEPNATATLDTVLSGSVDIAKRDAGTLIFTKANTYVGNTRLEGGVLQISADNQLGDAANGVVFAGGTLRYAGTAPGAASRAWTLQGAGGVDVADAAAVYTVNGVVSGTTAAGTLTKTGAGTLVLNGANTYVGGTQLQAGTLKVGNNTALGTGVLTAAAGTTLANDTALTLANNAVLQGDLTVQSSQALTLGGSLSGAGGLVKTGTGTLTLAGNNSYQGNTQLTAGQITVGSNTALGTGSLIAADGTQLDAGAATQLQNAVVLNGALTLPGSNDLTLAGAVNGAGSLVKNGASTLTLGNANSFGGGVQLNGGTLAVGNNGALGSGTLTTSGGATLSATAPVTLANAVTLGAGTTTVTGANLGLSGVISGAGAIDKTGAGVLTLTGSNNYGGGTTLAGGTLVVGGSSALGSGALTAAAGTTLSGLGNASLTNNVTLGGSVTVNGSDSLTLAGVVDGSGPLVKTGTSTLTLNGANTYTGGTTLAGGTLVAGGNTALGSGGLSVTGASTLQAGASGVALANLVNLGAALTVSGANDLTLAGNITGAGSLTKSGAGTLTLSGQNQYSGGTTLAGGTLIGDTHSLTGAIGTATGTSLVFNQATGDDGSFGGVISGGGSLTKNGGGTVTLTGANTYTGGTTINAGTLAGNATSLQGNINIVDGSALIFNQTGADGTYGGNITTTGNNTGTLTKDGSANLTLTGNNTVGGGTTVNGGTLLVNGTLGGRNVTVNAGGSLGGSGSVATDVTLGNGAHLVAGTPGNPISFAQNLNLSTGTQLDFTLGAPNSATTAVTVGQNLALNGILNIYDGGNLGTGVYRLFSYAGTMTGAGLTYGVLPSGYTSANLTLQNQPNQVNLVLQSQPGEILFWNGAKTTPDGVIAGGSGTWNAAGNNWTDASGNLASHWNGKYAAFSGASGTVTIDGSQAVTGVQFLTSGYTLAAGAGGQLGIAQALTPFRVEAGGTATIAAPITGAGGIEKGNGGTLILAGNNTYTGNTSIRSGVLQVTQDSQLGNGGAISLNGGTLRIADAGYATTARTISLDGTGGGLDIVAANQTFTLNQSINGTGALLKQGDGTLVLNGVNAYAGGTVIAGGTLEGNSASVKGNVSTSAGTTLRMNQGADGAMTGGISGGGQLVKDGAGALTLTQPSTYTGGTRINAGTLIGDTSSLQGAITNNATLVFNQGSDGNFSGSLAGAGTIVKQGGGSLGVGGSQTFNGTVAINGGTLQLGSAQAPATLPAAVQVNSGGTLSGYGTIASLTNAGTVVSGSGAGGGLKVSNNFSNGAGATLAVGVGPNAGPNVHVTGTAALGGTLKVTSNGPLTGNDTFTVLTADQGRQGVFASTVLPQLAFVDAAVGYDPNNVTVSFTRNQTGFGSVAQTPNQRAVAGALGGIDPNSALYGALLGLTADEAAAAFKQLSGDSHASLASALIRSSESARALPLNHLRDSLQSENTQDGRPCDEALRTNGGYSQRFSCQRNIWAEVIGNWQSQDGDGNAPSYKQRVGGVQAGGDIRVGDGWRVGMALGYQDSTIWQDSRNARAKVDSYSVSLFGGKSFVQPGGSAWNLMAGAAYSWHRIDNRRDLTLAGQNQELKTKYDGNTTQIFGELGYAIPVSPRATVEPFVGAAWIKQRMGGFSENGGSAALSAGSDSNDITTTTVGLRGKLDTEIAGAPARLRASLGWRHAMGDVDPERTMAFSSGPSFTVAGTPVARNAAVTELGAEIAVSKNASIGLGYQGQFGNGSR